MPIFRDPDGQKPSHPSAGGHDAEGGGTGIRQPDDHMEVLETSQDDLMEDITPSNQDMGSQSPPKLQTSSREELIESIKRGESPTWIPSPAEQLENYFAAHGDHPHLRVQGELKKEDGETVSPRKGGDGQSSPDRETSSVESLGSPHDIQRPRSALHAGDFREGSPDAREDAPFFSSPPSGRFFNIPGPAHWYNPEAVRKQSNRGPDQVLHGTRTRSSVTRARAPSLGSFSSSYVLKAPTSPLVYQANNPDLDFSPKPGVAELDIGPDKADRRRTLPPETFLSMRLSPQNSFGSSTFWREGPLSFRSHQSRRSITSPYTLQLASPQSPGRSRFRRQSFSTDGSPLHNPSHLSMVGSYEESILRGRMSTTPSKPLDFTAQIGVLGRGNCKSNLKCPPHVTVSFPAVFYAYSTSGSGRSIADDSPSPYVGFIDIENSLLPERRSSPRPARRRHASPAKCPCAHPVPADIYSELPAPPHKERRAREKRSRRSPLSHSPPGGCYRIPPQGQIQIIIKNPNKTAVKLFLVPYDLEGMEPGTKTFIRQRSYSVGPVIESPLTSQPADVSKQISGEEDKPVLRYLAHLNICCTAKGRYYLYSGIRVVFANRVPDGKERLRNEIQYPEPRYSPYRPARESSSFSKAAADTVFRRQSSSLEHDIGDTIPLSFSPFEQYGQNQARPSALRAAGMPGSVLFPDSSPHPRASDWFGEPISVPSSRPTRSPFSGFRTSQLSTLSQDEISQIDSELFGIGATDEAESSHHTPSGSPGGSEIGESLLARKLRNLDVVKRDLWSP